MSFTVIDIAKTNAEELVSKALTRSFTEFKETVESRNAFLNELLPQVMDVVQEVTKMGVNVEQFEMKINDILTMDDVSFRDQMCDNIFGVTLCYFTDSDGLYYTISICGDEPDEEGCDVGLTIIRADFRDSESTFKVLVNNENGESEWEDLHKALGEVDPAFNEAIMNATDTQRLIMKRDDSDPERTFLECLIGKYGSVSDEKYEEEKKNYLPMISMAMDTGSVFALTASGEIVLRGADNAGYAVKKEDGVWKIYQYFDDVDLIDCEIEAKSTYMRYIYDDTNDGRVRGLLAENGIPVFRLPLSSHTAVSSPEWVDLQKLKAIALQSKNLTEEERKNLNAFCRWVAKYMD